jgi:plastocyanin
VKSLVALSVLALAAFAHGCSPSGATPTPPAGSPTGSPSSTQTAAVSCLPAGVDGDAAVAVIDFAFQPSDVSVAAGGVVTWTNTGQAPHTVALDNGPTCDNERMSIGARHSVQFNEPGEYLYHCGIHGTMQAKVTVTP